MPFSRGKTGFFSTTSKERKGKKNKTKNKGGGFIAKWGGPSGHLTWNKKRKKKKKKTRNKHNNTPPPQKKKKLSIISRFFFFWWVSKISLFWQLGQKARTQKTPKNRGFSNPIFGKQFCVKQPIFWKTILRHETAIFGRDTHIMITEQNKSPETPIFIVRKWPRTS